MMKNLSNTVSFAQKLATRAQRLGKSKAARQATQLARTAQQLANTERSLAKQIKALNNALSQVSRGVDSSGGGGLSGSPAPVLPAGGRGSQAAGSPVAGIVGRKPKKGTVHMVPSEGNSISTKVMAAGFQKLLSTYSEISKLRAEVDRLKGKK